MTVTHDGDRLSQVAIVESTGRRHLPVNQLREVSPGFGPRVSTERQLRPDPGECTLNVEAVGAWVVATEDG